MRELPKDQLEPPDWATRFLRWYCRSELVDEVEGDLYELFQRRVHTQSLWKAQAFYWLNVLAFLHPDYIRKKKHYSTNHTAMFKNYFTIGWRNLNKQKMYSAINIGGFALGIATCLLIGLFIRHELSYDTHYQDGGRIYRVIGEYKINGETLKNVYFPSAMEEILQSDFPEISLSGHFIGSELLGTGNIMLRRADEVENRYEEGYIYADQGLLEVLQPHFMQGDISQTLRDPYTLVISKSKAKQYFPDEDPLGKTLIFNDNEAKPYTIHGIYEDFPSTSHFQYDFLLSDSEFPTEWKTFQGPNIFHTYIKVQEGTDVELLESKITEGVLQTYMLSKWKNEGIVGAEELVNNASLELQAVGDIHLRSSGIHDGLRHGDIRFVWLFGTIAGFILLIASINFINLSTAKSANRAKEVGLRKVMGSYRSHLVHQFLTESVLFSFLAFMVALLLAWFLLPYFNELSSKSLVFPWRAWWFFPLLGTAAVLIGILAGLYPSVYLSAFQPIKVLKGGLSRGSKSSKMRNALVVFQFTTSIVLIIGTFIIYQQLDFILTKDVGFDKEQVLLIQGADVMGERVGGFRNELLALSEVAHVSVSDYLPIAGSRRNGSSFYVKGRETTDSPVGGQMWFVDHDYISTMGMELTAGRNFNEDMQSDGQAVIINQTMAKELGLVDPIGQEISQQGQSYQVIGVVEDFHFESLTENIEPLCLFMGNSGSIVSVKVNTAEMSQLIESIHEVWSRFSPNEPFRYTFLNESFAMMYQNVQRMGRIFISFAILAIVVACLGLFALSAFMAEQRRKEISVRLILGASLNSVFRLLTQNYLLMVLISLVIAAPIAWYMMQRWLEDYEYRIQIGWEVFLWAGIIASVIAMLTISYQSLRAALINPVDNLRDE